MNRLEIIPVTGLPEIVPGDDLAALIAGATDVADGDVVVVAQKIVSKAEGATLALPPRADPAAARRETARGLATRIVAETADVLIVETAHGLVCANAGLDASNAPPGVLLRLPDDPDASARTLRAGLRAATGADVAVVVADTFGRPWRIGLTDVAIGVAGLTPLRDERGGVDRGGRRLDATLVAVADEVAAAADLVRRKADGVPAVVVRGLDWRPDEAAHATALVRPAHEDLFRRGRGGLAAALESPPERGADAAGDPVTHDDLERALSAVAATGAVVRPSTGPAPTTLAVAADDEVTAGVAAGLLVAVLVDLGYSAWHRMPRAGEPGTAIVEARREPSHDRGR